MAHVKFDTLIEPEKIAQEIYGIDCSSKPLAGEVDQNFLLTTNKGEKFVLKLSKVPYDLVKAQNNLLKHLSDNFPELGVQKVIPSTDGDLFKRQIDNENWNIRLLSYLEGSHFSEVDHTEDLMESFGKFLGNLTKSLQGFYDVEFNARILKWDLQQAKLSMDIAKSISDPSDRKLVDYYFLQYREWVAPQMNLLRHSVIYGDANDWNVLVNENRVTGVIDFGDAVFTQTINELAIAIAYAIMSKEYPLYWANLIIKGFHSEFSLEKEELDIFYFLIATRLCISVCQSAKSKVDNPENEYLGISEEPAWNLLRKWIRINPIKARNSFYESCNFSKEEGGNTERLALEREKHLSKALSISYSKPIQMETASFQYMFDKEGRTYLDLVNNIMHVGHCHPKVVEAGQRQMAKLNTNTRYHYDALYEYLDKLSKFLPTHLSKVFLVNSGSAASDLAIRISKTHTGRNKVMVMDHGYHGNTTTGIEISPYKFQGKGGFPKPENIIKAELPDAYRSGERTTEDFNKSEKKQIDQEADILSAFIVEPIVGCGGQVPLPDLYLKEVFAYIRSKGGVAIADEVQTGFGRVGAHFWAFEQQNAIPDILVLGKPMGNGHPMAAVVTTSEIAASFENGMEFFSSFGGNPVSCAIGKAVLEVIEEEALQANALDMGDLIKQETLKLMKDHPIIGDVRGTGLFLGLELVIDENKNPATSLAKELTNRMKDNGILLSTDGPYNNVIKIKPPLCINHSDVEFLIENLDKELSLLTQQLK